MKLEVRIKKQLRNFLLDIDFVAENEVFALLGASGCGKSMTLKCIAGIETPDSGRIVLNGRVLYDSERKINLKPQERRVGYLFQNYALFPNMTIGDNLRFVAQGTKAEREKKVIANLNRFSLLELKDAYPRELSGGQQQRAAFARCLAAEAEILLLDEPFSALDSYLKWQLELELNDVLKSYEGTALLVSHDRGEVYRLANRIAVIHRGQMENVHTRKGLFSSPDSLAATLLTGCKNVSAVQPLSEHRIFATDWQMELTTATSTQNAKFAGIRAHYFEYRTEPGENTQLMEVVRVIEDVFSYLIMVRKKGSNGRLIRWELSKEEWRNIQSKEVYLYISPKDVMLMSH